ncbi:LysR family transcriptional regulator [Reyranella sp. CPCC 100927]|uniref:LysR family transcriptional regulator n=1 Tax=Reyranella sp. CPCC 100927 TaxID=2599616 RepID=UPI0011B7F0AB|nr:LysR family transcriptional regulator [Reyranella sp. CPCC 100927]TWS95112.1 LysR family transcriptional regulator [Reyranella sp. CPCC 100927]
MDIDAKPYRAFVAVAEERSFGRAAARLQVSQPALSAQIREFERLLGFPLFNRTSRVVELSVQGRLFLGNARRMLFETEIARNTARAIQTNQLAIGATVQTMLVAERVNLLDRFILQRPDIPLRVANDTDARLRAALARREIDLALLIEPMLGGAVTYSPLDPHSASVTEIERLVLRRRRVEVLLPREHPASRHAVLPLSALKKMRIAMFDRAYGVALITAILQFVRSAGGTLTRPPERNALAVERYGAVKRVPAISLGWFGRSHLAGLAPMVSRPIEGLDAETGLVLLRAQGEGHPATATMWKIAAELASHRQPPVRGSTRRASTGT